ncbi:MAG: aminotransferase class V-fold PLP-dependent enzyme [Acidimicrobiales bacterium]|nr:SufS family cysteine desulfurase [Actinomycetota bacterium]
MPGPRPVLSLDPLKVKQDFPIFEGDDAHRGLVFLDSAASSQKPWAVLNAMEHYYETTHANVHRGVYAIAEGATAAYEDARRAVARFIGAPTPRSVVFTKNATEAINLVAHSWARSNLGPGDVVLLSEMEHHANFVPWLMLREERGVELRFIGLGHDGYLDLTDLDRLLDGVRLVAVTAMSNVLGTLPPVRRIADAAHAGGALVLLDGAQYVPHLPTRVSELGCDFLAFSAHKMCGPTGIGALWGREELLEGMPAFLGGGEMIRDVRLDGWLPNELPWKFEAGTPPIAEAVGFGAAVEYLEALGMEAVREHELSLTEYALRTLRERHGDDLVVHGPTELHERGGVISFAYKDIHPHDLSQVLDQAGVCVRAGHHCAKPLMRRLGLTATARASFYVYNDESDVDALSDGLVAAAELFAA